MQVEVDSARRRRCHMTAQMKSGRAWLTMLAVSWWSGSA